MTTLPLVSVIIACRNERALIGTCLDSVLASDYPADHLEILVADGMGVDGPIDMLEEYRIRHSNIRVIDNPRKVVPTGLNLAILLVRGEIIIRIDATRNMLLITSQNVSQCFWRQVQAMRSQGARHGREYPTRLHRFRFAQNVTRRGP
jgi:glycosyltransferase involved in cell wall biosynthesis